MRLFKKVCFGPKAGLDTPAERKFVASTTRKIRFSSLAHCTLFTVVTEIPHIL